MKKCFVILSLLSAVIVSACMQTELAQSDKDILSDINLSEIFVPESRLILYADLSEYELMPGTKAGYSAENYYSLESLLILTAKKQYISDEKTFLQVPFKKDSCEGYVYYGNDSDAGASLSTVTKKFLIKGDEAFIVTMITDYDYARMNPEFDYIDSPNYYGAIIFSELDGTFIKAQVNSNGLVIPASLIKKTNRTIESEDLMYIKVFESGSSVPSTRAGDSNQGSSSMGEVFNGSKCIAEYDVKPWWEGSDSYSDSYLPDMGGYPTGGGSGGNGRNNGNNSESTKGDKTDTNSSNFTVSLTNNLQDYVHVTGSGTYRKGTKVSVGCIYNISGNEITYVDFGYWSGDFADRKSVSFNFTVNRKINSTAYFDASRPCRDGQHHRVNPLMDMQVAPSNKYGNYAGGTFGWTRINEETNEPKEHRGLDLYAEPGTPIYAISTGRISKIEAKSPKKYVEKSYGNYIEVQNGNTYYLYAHLQYGNAVAYNYRENRNYKEGDIIYEGDLIGYAGRTGNATDVPFAHLHLGIFIGGDRNNGTAVDPLGYINGSYDANTINHTKGAIDNIKCD